VHLLRRFHRFARTSLSKAVIGNSEQNRRARSGLGLYDGSLRSRLRARARATSSRFAFRLFHTSGTSALWAAVLVLARIMADPSEEPRFVRALPSRNTPSAQNSPRAPAPTAPASVLPRRGTELTEQPITRARVTVGHSMRSAADAVLRPPEALRSSQGLAGGKWGLKPSQLQPTPPEKPMSVRALTPTRPISPSSPVRPRSPTVKTRSRVATQASSQFSVEPLGAGDYNPLLLDNNVVELPRSKFQGASRSLRLLSILVGMEEDLQGRRGLVSEAEGRSDGAVSHSVRLSRHPLTRKQAITGSLELLRLFARLEKLEAVSPYVCFV
jgi:hypothetical protein